MSVRIWVRDHQGSNTYTPVVDLGEGISSTDAIDGNYEGNAHLFALELAKTFLRQAVLKI